MLRVTVVDDGAEQRLLVEGKLVAPWVKELESVWKKVQEARRDRRIVVDLSEMTSIDSSGQAALMAMIGEGARLTAKGVYNEYLVKELMNKAREARASRQRHNGASVMDSSSAKESSQAGQRSPSKERH